MVSRCLLHLRVCEYRVEQVSCPHCQQVSQWGFPAEVYLHHYQLQAMEHTCGALADVRSQVTVHPLD